MRPTLSAVAGPPRSSRQSPVSLLLALNLEIALDVIVIPGSDDRAIVEPEIFDLSIHNVMNRLAGGVLRVGLEVDDPAFWIERRVLERDGSGTGLI